MFRADVADARAEWLETAEYDLDEYERRLQSDFLADESHHGERLDFYSLQCTCGAGVAMIGPIRKRFKL